jgi:hypothetical protein
MLSDAAAPVDEVQTYDTSAFPDVPLHDTGPICRFHVYVGVQLSKFP